MFADILQLLVAGLATGALYALVAIGFTLLWQTSQTINFAQGEFVMLPAFFALASMAWLGLPFASAVVIAIAASMFMLGLVFKFVVVQPLIRQGVLPLVISTIALSILLKEGATDAYSAEAHPFPTLFPDVTLSLAGIPTLAGFTGKFYLFSAAVKSGSEATVKEPSSPPRFTVRLDVGFVNVVTSKVGMAF